MNYNLGELLGGILMVVGTILVVAFVFVEKTIENAMMTIGLGVGFVVGGTMLLFIFYGLGRPDNAEKSASDLLGKND